MWFIFIPILFSAVDLTSVDKFTGEWLPIVTFPNVVTYPICDKYNITIEKENACRCGDSTVPLIKSGKPLTDTPARSITMPTIIVESAEEVAAALEVKCKCGQEFTRQAVYRLINDNYFVVYEKLPQNFYGPEEPNTANLLVKNVETTADLKKVIDSISELKNRSAGIMCDPDKDYKKS
ncbi:uncharacterized protein [Battus philenor]|uniref:uncharacterized protein n=1 Tax=Battus philenor TaxID=42288 RepID=UPI0035D09548